MTTLTKRKWKHRKTVKKPLKIQGRIVEKKEGWISVSIYGDPFDRGFAHGALLYREIQKNRKRLAYNIEHNFHTTSQEYLSLCKQKIVPVVQKKFPEIYEEIRGIAAGCQHRRFSISVEELIAWNALESLHSHYYKKASRCSAFIATGEATEKGDIVMAHNTHCDFVTGQAFRIVLYITPTEGSPFVMQTSAGGVASTTDWFICSTGIIGCETTITTVNYEPRFGSPYFCRIRQAMQYGKTLDDYVRLMLKDNAGDYASSWQFGDIHTGEIMLLELGLREHSIQRTHNGVFYGMNSAMDVTLRSKETDDQSHYDGETSCGARNARLNHLLNETYYGKINVKNAQRIISDHYDSFLHKTVPNSRGICKHMEQDPVYGPRGHFYPFGCTDGKVVNTQLAQELRFWGRFGSCCGRVFLAKKHLQEHPEYGYMRGVLEDFPKTDWTLLGGPGLFVQSIKKPAGTPEGCNGAPRNP